MGRNGGESLKMVAFALLSCASARVSLERQQ
jgi:hypothetical protein